jgi:hypothetical protein
VEGEGTGPGEGLERSVTAVAVEERTVMRDDGWWATELGFTVVGGSITVNHIGGQRGRRGALPRPQVDSGRGQSS